MAVATGSLCSCLARYVLLGLLASCVIYTTVYQLSTEDLRRNAADLIQRGGAPVEQQKPTFDVANIHYGPQQLDFAYGGKGDKHFVDEDFYLSKAFGNAMQPSKVIPYYFKAQRTFDKEEVTITTLITENRFGVFKKLVRNYKGPISVAFWIKDDEFKDEHFTRLHQLYEEEPLLREYVDMHVVVDKFDFQLNMWRNTGRLFARTDYFMLLDVDFHICTDLKTHLKQSPQAMELLRKGNALVLPAFEYKDEEDGVDSATFPTDKHVVEKLVQNKKLMAFHSAKFAPGHEASNYPKWYQTDEIYQVTAFTWKYEPYVILKREGTPWCDERFVGYGANKAACLYEIFISGIDYYVLPNDFLIHQSHAYPESKRSGGRKLNADLYTAFRDELCFRYAKAMYFANELDTPKAANLKSQCSKLKGFTAAMNSFSEMWPTTNTLDSRK